VKKAGIIRCRETEEMCPGTMDFKVAKEGKGAFEETGPVELVGYLTCGGCPGKRVAYRAEMMVEKKKAEVIAFGSCITKGNHAYPCPNFESIKKAVTEKIGDRALILDWTH